MHLRKNLSAGLAAAMLLPLFCSHARSATTLHAIAGGGLHKSTDGGRTWQKLPLPALSNPHFPKKCMGRVKYFSRNQIVKMSNATREVRPKP